MLAVGAAYLGGIGRNGLSDRGLSRLHDTTLHDIALHIIGLGHQCRVISYLGRYALGLDWP